MIMKGNTHLDEFQNDNVHSYYIDFLPQKIENKQYKEIKEFYIENYLECYADKLINILIKLTVFFDLKMYLTEFPQELDTEISKEYSKLVGSDICSFKIEEWTKIIKFVILEDISSVQILSINPRFLISIYGNFFNEFCRIPDSKKKLMKTIVEQEGLFFIEKNE